jgi:hypothetical protein
MPNTDLCPIVSPGSRPGGHPVEAVRQGVPIIKSERGTNIYFSKRKPTVVTARRKTYTLFMREVYLFTQEGGGG